MPAGFAAAGGSARRPRRGAEPGWLTRRARRAQARNPKRDLPIAIIGSLTLATVLYVLVRRPADSAGYNGLSVG